MLHRSDSESPEGARSVSYGLTAVIVGVLVIVCDQWLKIWVKTHLWLGESYEIFPWFDLKFIENNGMAFGIELWSKFLLTLLRIVAVVLLCVAISKLRKTEWVRRGFIITLALIAAGAAGNIFDCVFYGEIFSNPMPPQIAEFLPEGGGYAGWFEGRVVDMLYFHFFSFTFPGWIPGLGGVEFEFFQYIFNIADSAICVGVFLLIIFYSSDFQKAIDFFRAKWKKENPAE